MSYFYDIKKVKASSGTPPAAQVSLPIGAGQKPKTIKEVKLIFGNQPQLGV